MFQIFYHFKKGGFKMNKILSRIIVFIVIMTSVCIILAIPQPQQTQYTRTDLILVKNYIMEKIIFNEEDIEYYDTNKDGKVTSSDYVFIKNQIKEGNYEITS
jgi:hypothetical protein